MAGGGVVPSKAYADDVGLRVGDRLTLDGAAGTRTRPVVGIADALDGAGQSLHMSLETMAGVYGLSADSQLAVKAASPEARDALATRVNALLERDYPGLEALSNAEVKKQATDAINQQFGFFNAIVGIAVLVGMLGVVNTLTMSVLERTREIGVLRALGASRWRVRRAMADESLLISLAGTFAGMLAGLLVAVVWIVAMRENTSRLGDLGQHARGRRSWAREDTSRMVVVEPFPRRRERGQRLLLQFVSQVRPAERLEREVAEPIGGHHHQLPVARVAETLGEGEGIAAPLGFVIADDDGTEHRGLLACPSRRYSRPSARPSGTHVFQTVRSRRVVVARAGESRSTRPRVCTGLRLRLGRRTWENSSMAVDRQPRHGPAERVEAMLAILRERAAVRRPRGTRVPGPVRREIAELGRDHEEPRAERSPQASQRRTPR